MLSNHAKIDIVEFMKVPFPEGLSNLYAPLVHMKGGALACRIMQLAFVRGAYVAGGLARRYFSPVEPGFNHTVAIVNYLFNARGDIDLFFPDETSLGIFWNDYKNDGVLGAARLPQTSLPTGMATEILCWDVRVQVITRFLAPIEEQLQRFDIYNAMVAFNLDGGIVPTHWHALEELKLLHVVNWSSIFVIHRLSKWMYRHSYLGLSPKTAGEIGSVALDIINQLKEKPRQNPWGGEMTHNDVVHKLKKFLPYLTSEQLLLISTITPIDAYDGAFGILQRRTVWDQPPITLNNIAETNY